MLGNLIGAGASLLGGLIGRQSNEAQMEANRALQREFATSGIQWKVEDAKKAGIHPLYALGAPTMSPSIQTMQDPMGSAISSMGQDLSRAVAATAAPEARNLGVMEGLAVERAGLQNELLRSQIARLNSQVGPGVPTVSDPWKTGVPVNDAGDAARVSNDPAKITPGAVQDPGSGPGAHSDVDWVRTRDGGYTATPGKAVKDRIEDMGFEPQLWSWRNRIMPYLTGRLPPPFDPPAGTHWVFWHSLQTWYPSSK
jgi:hypothetical protein